MLGAERSYRGRDAHLGEHALQAGLGRLVDVDHRGADRGVDLGDLGVHLPGDRAVARVPLAPRSELDELHRLAGVEVEHVADAVAEAQRVGRGARKARADEPLVLGP